MGSSSESGHPVGYRIHAADNVATLLGTARSGKVLVRGAGEPKTVVLSQAVEMGHKVATEPISSGAEIVKYGVVIGLATQAIRAGEWVHLHNCRSQMDERSAGFDVHTGLPEDTKYE